MGKVLAESWVGQRAQFESVDFQVRPNDFGYIGAACEQLLQEGFSQTAYLVNDIVEYGGFRPETKQRVTNELIGVALEKLGKPFCTELVYQNGPNGLVAENGETLRVLNERGLAQAIEEQSRDQRLAFITPRRRADLALLDFVENEMVAGETVIVSSACPSAEELQIPVQILEDAHYQPELDQAMVWIITKGQTAANFKTVNLFHADPEILAETVARVTARPVAIESRERTPWNKVVISGSAEGIEDAIIETFDQIATSRRGEETFHGLTSSERGTTEFLSSDDLTKDNQFTQMLAATENILESIATSITGEACVVPSAYLQKILTIKKPDGTYELENEKRRAVMKLLNGSASAKEALSAYQVVHTAACSGLWATIDQLYHQQGSTGKSEYSDGNTVTAIGGLNNLQSSRNSGHSERGCPGDTKSNNEVKSIFEMNQAEVASTIFGRKVIQTNCPKCETKGVEAVIERGTITCKTCDACVDVCTGRTLRNARFKKRAGKLAKQTWSLFGPKIITKEKPEFKLLDFSKSKQLRNVQKHPKHETIKAA